MFICLNHYELIDLNKLGTRIALSFTSELLQFGSGVIFTQNLNCFQFFWHDRMNPGSSGTVPASDGEFALSPQSFHSFSLEIIFEEHNPESEDIIAPGLFIIPMTF